MNPNSARLPKPQPLRERLRVVAADAILQAAEQVFSEQGMHAAKMETIAARAGVAVGTLYNHFADRHALLEALLAERREGMVALLDQSLESKKGRPFEEQLQDFVAQILGYFERRGSLAALAAEAEPTPALRKSKEVTVASLEMRTKELFRRGVQSKALDGERAQWLPVLMLGMLRGVLEHSRAHSENEQRTAAQWATEIVALILHGAGRNSGSGKRE